MESFKDNGTVLQPYGGLQLNFWIKSYQNLKKNEFENPKIFSNNKIGANCIEFEVKFEIPRFPATSNDSSQVPPSQSTFKKPNL